MAFHFLIALSFAVYFSFAVAPFSFTVVHLVHVEDVVFFSQTQIDAKKREDKTFLLCQSRGQQESREDSAAVLLFVATLVLKLDGENPKLLRSGSC